MKRAEYLAIATFLIVVVATIILGVILFKKANTGSTDGQLDVVHAKDETIAAIKSERSVWEKLAAEKDSSISYLKQQTATYLDAANKNQTFYVSNKKQYEAIPAAVRNLSKDSLRRAILEFK